MVKWASKLIVGWALFGGVILLLLVIMTTYSAAAGFLIALPFLGILNSLKWEWQSLPLRSFLTAN